MTRTCIVQSISPKLTFQRQLKVLIFLILDVINETFSNIILVTVFELYTKCSLLMTLESWSYIVSPDEINTGYSVKFVFQINTCNMWDKLVLTNCTLLIWNSNWTGHLIFLFVQSGNPTLMIWWRNNTAIPQVSLSFKAQGCRLKAVMLFEFCSYFLLSLFAIQWLHYL